MVETNDINPFLPELVLKDAIAPDEAWYFCEATNVAGKVRSNLASLKVFGEFKDEINFAISSVFVK